MKSVVEEWRKGGREERKKAFVLLIGRIFGMR